MCFRDSALGPATLAYAQELEESVEALNATLYNTSAFAVGPNFEGIIGVATEIVAKKVCSFPSLYIAAEKRSGASAGLTRRSRLLLSRPRCGPVRSITDNLLCLPN